MNGIKANARRRVEQDVDLFLKTSEMKISGQLHDERFITKQKADEVLKCLHGGFGKHPGITKTITAYREK